MKTEEERLMHTLLIRLAKAIYIIYPESDAPKVLGEEKGFDRDTLCWDGPFEWCSCLVGGCSIFAGEFGNYGSSTLEEPLQKVIEEIETCGYHLEPVDSSSQICIYD